MFADTVLGKVVQWGYLVKDMDEAMTCWVEQLGVGPWWGYRNVPLKSVVDGVESDIKINVGLAYHQGVQIELIQQVCDNDSPYSDFYRNSDNPQVFQQIAYMVPDTAKAIEQCKARGMSEVGRVIPAPGADCIYLSSPAMKGMVIELMPHDQGFLDEYARCAKEAESWDGNDPYRLITF